jgi:sigma-B regulation protein RsbU (phosphoserine phosphatase)
MFASIFFGILDPAKGSLIYINGGHEPPVVVNQSGIKAVLTATGPVVGLRPNVQFQIRQVDLDPGDILVAYTDGAADARNPSRDFYTEERLLASISQSAPSAEALLERVRREILAHVAGADLFDDVTLLALRRKTGQETTA